MDKEARPLLCAADSSGGKGCTLFKQRGQLSQMEVTAPRIELELEKINTITDATVFESRSKGIYWVE